MSTPGAVLDQIRLCLQSGDPRQAELLCRDLLRAEAQNFDAWCALGAALQAQGQRPQAADAYRQTLQLQPQHAQALNSLGVLLAEAGQVEEAVRLLQQAVYARPEFPPAHHNLGVALAQLGRPHDAVRSLEEALRLQPAYAEAAWNLANVLRDLGRRDDALARYRQALECQPAYGLAYTNLGTTLLEAGRFEEAVVMLRQGTRLQPASKEAHNSLGLGLAALGRFAEAEVSYQEALRLDPRYPDAHANLGSAAQALGRLEEALACYQIALWLDPRSASLHYNRSLILLEKGAYQQGWAAYEWRWQRKQMPPRPFRQPRWDGSPLQGRTILLYMEQGLGDMLQFLRYAPLVRATGGVVLVECPAFLLPLFSTCSGIDRLIAEGQPLPDFDVQAPLLSLPGLLGTTLATVPARVPYLRPQPDRFARWSERLEQIPGFRVGVVWQGNPHHPHDRHRSFPLQCLAPLAAVAEVRLVSLQKGSGAEQLRQVGGQFDVVELPNLDAEGGFLDTAAVMSRLDLVVSTDTAAAHLAGALGVRTWVALAAAADWRWLRDRPDSPWYPTLRLFRQKHHGQWGPVFARMADELRQLAAGR